IWDIPASTTSLPEGLGLGFNVPQVPGAKQKAMSSGNKSLQYFGPCPGGSTHRYEFTLYALDVATLPGVSASSTPAAAFVDPSEIQSKEKPHKLLKSWQ
ncbi:MAG: hypothetical protein ICV86_19955, partial [Microcoleus sp. T3-bin5]|nr:hypothetical protein [Microcoleus sp. T3-bin5]